MTENTYVAAYNTMRPQCPVCTHCGKSGHTIQKCFKAHGYPPGYKTSASSSAYRPPFQARMQQSTQPTMQLPTSSYPDSTQKANAIANVYSEIGTPMPYYPQLQHPQAMISHITSGGNTLTLHDFSPQQIQNLISQFNTQVKVQEPPTPPSSTSIPTKVATATITEHGVMAPQSSSGIFPFPSTSLKYENNNLIFQNHILSSIHSFLSCDAWILDSGASSHVCSDPM